MKYFFILILFFSNAIQAETLETAIMPGQVIQGHAKYEGQCENCHKRFDKLGQDKLCADCHKDIGKDLATKQGFHGRQLGDKSCRDCHAEHKGRLAKIVTLDEKSFKHKDTDFQLKGKHAEDKVKCADCHKVKAKWRDAPHDCFACHKKDDEKAHGGKLGQDCAKCHTEKDWKVADFDHSKTDFELKGKHVDTKCESCHANNRYKDTPKLCFDCHKKDDDKVHKRVFGTKCATCHGESSWKEDIRFNHNKDTKFNLLDKHKDAKCDSCHKVAGEKLKSACISCHKKDDKHNGSLGEQCGNCHNAATWKSPKGFDHNRDTKYPLKDKHKEAKCESCHVSGHQYDKLPMDCWSCHKREDEKAHKANFGQKCESCHRENDWKKIYFNHDKDTKYPLLYKHFDVKCDKCHTGKLYVQKLTAVCYDCHKKTDDKDAHRGSLGKECDKCHTEKGWKDNVKFDHNKTKFPLLGVHFKTECKKCHETPKYNDAKTDCYACHKKEDKHELRLGKKCDSCHNARDWKAWDFDHDKRTHYRLTGAHKKVECLDCHRLPVAADKLNTPTSCAACHANEDVHEGGFGKQCERCHSTSSFKEIKSNLTP